MNVLNKNRSQMESITEVVSKLVGTQNKRNIAILVSKFSKFEGAGSVAWQQARELSAHNYNVTIFTFKSDFNPPQNIKVVLLQPDLIRGTFIEDFYRAFFSINPFTAMPLILKLKHFDLIIVHQGNLAILGYLCKKFWGTKVVFWNHHIGQPFFKLTSLDILRNIYSKIFYNFFLKFIKNFDLIVSVSHFSQKKLKEIAGLDSIVIYNRVDSRKFQKGLDGKIIRKMHGISDDDPVILYVGRIVPHKGIHNLIKAFNLVKKQYPSAKLLIVGKCYHDKYFAELTKLADESVIFVGPVGEDELPLYYAACDVYATCSIFEGFNLPLAEAQACGKPVVAFDIGPHRELVKNGFLVKVGDIDEFSKKLVQLLQRTKKRG